ncbi:MAG: hypothetical protein C4324_06425 [Blastocatellia bacterium]
MIVYLHTVEKIDKARTFARHERSDVRHIGVPPGIDVRLLAKYVVRQFSEEEQKNPEGLIELLLINSEGNSGELYLGGAASEGSYVYIGNAVPFGRSFARLLMPPRKGGQGVEIHGCAVAAPEIDPRTGSIRDAESGLRFIFALACGFNSRVRASREPLGSENDDYFGESLAEAYPSDGDWQDNVITKFDFDAVGRFSPRHDSILKGRFVPNIRRLPVP